MSFQLSFFTFVYVNINSYYRAYSYVLVFVL